MNATAVRLERATELAWQTITNARRRRKYLPAGDFSPVETILFGGLFKVWTTLHCTEAAGTVKKPMARKDTAF